MKKILILLLVFVVLMGLTACNSDVVTEDVDNGTQDTEEVAEDIESKVEALEQTSVLISDVDVTEKLQMQTIDGVLYAEGESFIKAFDSNGFPEYIYEYNEMDEVILITSYATDVVLYKLYLNNTIAERLDDDFEQTYRDVELDAPAQYQDGMVWIPIEAFRVFNEELEIIY